MIVGFQGRKRAGKNEAAHRLAKLAAPCGWNVQFRSFADPLKAVVCDTFTLSRPQLDALKECDDDRRFGGLNMRELLQQLGTAMRAQFGELWLESCLPVGRGYDYESSLIIVTDVRQTLEVERIRELGGVIVRLDGGEEFDGHESEELPDEPDYLIDNAAHDFGVLDAALVRLWWWLCVGCPAGAH